ncbi:Aerobic cobaltochelatase CobT subunit [invertebrate metagenome]|uniref:Aerobic cobaltochelatase CobT subunit n=1 Tax=invertebrate metagenome TaxID=1711999 RepID=A0A484HAN5_9ZZZZ
MSHGKADEAGPVATFKQATAAAVRAVAKRGDIVVSYMVAGVPVTHDFQVHLPLPPPQTSIELLRGTADSMALRLRYHNNGIHRLHQPMTFPAQLIYDAMEQVRVEALGALRLPGVAANVFAAHEQHCQHAGYQHAVQAEEVPVEQALSLLALEEFTNRRACPATHHIAELWRQHLDSKAAATLAELCRTVEDQNAFAVIVRQFIATLGLEEGKAEARREEGKAEAVKREEDRTPYSSQAGTWEKRHKEDGEEERVEVSAASGAAVLIPRRGEASGEPLSQRGSHRGSREPTGYHAYSTRFDQVVEAGGLCDPDELIHLRTQLDQQLVHLQGIVSRLANRLQRRLLARQTRIWEFDLEEGLLDSGRLARIVANPLHALSFKRERETDCRDTVVTLLIDNSGSMRGRPIAVAAMSADILARTLERCGVKVEVLGFTTSAWKGGRLRELWIRDHKPPRPGRLNDLQHIIYKSADTPWRRARKNLGLMLREGILKENIDGEALLWAYSRLAARYEQRRILMVISDGAPVDESTLSVNPGNYLERHLREVIAWIENNSPIELIAIGIGHDVTRYYRRAVAIMNAEELGGTVMKQLLALFMEEEPGRQAGGAERARGSSPRKLAREGHRG